MHTPRHIGKILSIAFLAFVCMSPCNCNKNKKPPVQAKPPQAQAPVPAPVVQAPPAVPEGKQWVSKVIAQYPELRWLANAEVRKTEEGQAAVDKPYSEQIFGQKFIEFDRSIMSLYCLKLILDGSDKAYQEFTAAQPEKIRLSKESFQALHQQGMSLLNSNYQGMPPAEMQRAFETALVLGDMGKSEKAREVFKNYKANAPDHDDFHGQAMVVLKDHPRLCRSFMRLSFRSKQLLIKVANLAHYGHVTHLEGGPSMFTKLKASGIATTDPTALSFDLFVHTCDVAGALGHVNNTSSIVYTETTHKAMQAMANACRVLSDPAKTEADAYDAYINVRASWLGLNPSDRDDRVLTRIAAMLRLFTPEEGSALKTAILQLSPQDRERIASQLDVRFGEEAGRTPTYMPAVLVNP
ncbi:MAG TPA: hypothetical protein VMR37_06660, partial [Rhabdochlamydiaceae bacterium]|nr:hypothetical protein [Rhabdochlamydiaceae bacterium]